MSLAATIIDDEQGLSAVVPEWDALAIQNNRPYCAPAWMLAWWHHCRPDGAVLRIVAVREGGRLVGLGPFWTIEGRGSRAPYDVLAGKISPPTGPLSEPRRASEVAEAIAHALAAASPAPSRLQYWGRVEPESDGVSAHLAEAWPGHPPWATTAPPVSVPIVSLDGQGYDEWLAGRSSNFRQQAKRKRRGLEKDGAYFRLVEAPDIDQSIDALIDLHGVRWEGRGRSGALIPGLRSMLAEAASELAPSGRLRLFELRTDDQVIAATLYVAAGREANYWNSGFDEGWGRYSPLMQLTLFALQDAAERKEPWVSLGPGNHAYKWRLADTKEEVAPHWLVPRGFTYPLTRLRVESRLRLESSEVRSKLGSRLPPRVKRAVRKILRS